MTRGVGNASFDGHMSIDDMYFDSEDLIGDTESKKSKSSSKGTLEKLLSSPVLATPVARNKGLTSPHGGKGHNFSSTWDRFKNKLHLKKEEQDAGNAALSGQKGNESSKKLSSSDHAVNYRRNSLGRSPRTGRSKSRSGRKGDSSSDLWISATDDPVRVPATPTRSKSMKNIKPLALPAPGDEFKEPSSRGKSPKGGRTKKLKDSRHSSAAILDAEKAQERIRRKGSKKQGFLTPNPRSERFVELEDPARFTDMDISRRSKSASKRSSSVKKRKSDKPSETAALVPFGLPFGDDETTASKDETTASKNSRGSGSKSSKKKKEQPKSPGRKSSKRLLKVDVKGYESEISDLQNQVMRLQEEKYQEETDASKHLGDFKRKALDAKLELQRSQLENREVRSELRDKTSALKEAELDILDLEKRLREKANEVFLLEDEVVSAHNTIEQKSRQKSESTTDDNKSFDVDEVSIGGMEEKLQASLREKDAKIEALEKEMQRLENGGGAKDGEESLDDVVALKRDLRASHAEAQAMKSKYEGSQERNVTLDDEVQHWKSQSFNMEDELAEVRTQLNYWMAKYEDVVGASDSAKAQLSAPSQRPQYGHAHSLRDLSLLDTFPSELGTYDLDGSEHREEQATEGGGIGGLWKKLTTPAGTPKPKLNASNFSARQLSSTLH
jgi:hypothetical protein